jgi:acetoin utilization deacetylase AcuC-like enzyme
MKIFYSQSYTIAMHSFETTRKSRWIAESLEREPMAGIELIAPKPASATALNRVHDPKYVDAVRTGNPRELAESQGFRSSGKWYAPRTEGSSLPPSRHSAPGALRGLSQAGFIMLAEPAEWDSARSTVLSSPPVQSARRRRRHRAHP